MPALSLWADAGLASSFCCTAQRPRAGIFCHIQSITYKCFLVSQLLSFVSKAGHNFSWFLCPFCYSECFKLVDMIFMIGVALRSQIVERKIVLEHQQVHFVHIYAPSKKEGRIALHISVCMSVSLLHLVQWKTQEYFAPKTSNWVGR